MLTYFVEMSGARTDELYARPGVLEGLEQQQAGVALAMLDLSPERRELMAELARRRIPITAWLLLSKEEGYWLTVDNPDAAIALSILLIAVAACIVAGLGWRRLTGWAAAGRADG